MALPDLSRLRYELGKSQHLQESFVGSKACFEKTILDVFSENRTIIQLVNNEIKKLVPGKEDAAMTVESLEIQTSDELKDNTLKVKCKVKNVKQFVKELTNSIPPEGKSGIIRDMFNSVVATAKNAAAKIITEAALVDDSAELVVNVSLGTDGKNDSMNKCLNIDMEMESRPEESMNTFFQYVILICRKMEILPYKICI